MAFSQLRIDNDGFHEISRVRKLQRPEVEERSGGEVREKKKIRYYARCALFNKYLGSGGRSGKAVDREFGLGTYALQASRLQTRCHAHSTC